MKTAPTQNNQAASPVPPKRLWWLGAGFAIWCSALVVLYALHAIGCVFAWPTAALRISLVLVFLAHLAGVAWMWRNFAKAGSNCTDGKDKGENATGRFLHGAIVWVSMAALVATLLTFGPPLLLSTCI